MFDLKNPAVLVLLGLAVYYLLMSSTSSPLAPFNAGANALTNAVTSVATNASNSVNAMLGPNGNGNANAVNAVNGNVLNAVNAVNGNANALNVVNTNLNSPDRFPGANAPSNNGNANVLMTNQEHEKLEVMKRQNAMGCNAGMNDSMVPLASNGANEVGVSVNGIEANGMSGGLANGNGLGVPGVTAPNGNANGANTNGANANGANGNGSALNPLLPHKSQLDANDLLPQNSKMFAELHPNGEGPLDRSFLTSSFHIGIDTVGQSLRNANTGLRAEPANPQGVVSPWLNTTIGPDLTRRPLEGCE